MFCMRSVIFWTDRIAVPIRANLAVIVGITFRDDGPGYDDLTDAQYGELLLKRYG
jgi:hypothetical protein